MSAVSLNPHDLWNLTRAVSDNPPGMRVLGCEGMGTTESNEAVLVLPVIGDAERGRGDPTLDPEFQVLSDQLDGTLAEWALVPDASIVPVPSWLGRHEAACIGVAWGTAYRMLFTRGSIRAGDAVLVQGAGGVASAAIALAKAAGARVYAAARSPERQEFARTCGADRVVGPGERLPEQVDLVIETVGLATWEYSIRAVRPGGVIVIAGAASGAMPPAYLDHVFYRQISIVGSTGSTSAEVHELLAFMNSHTLRPYVDSIFPFRSLHEGLRRLESGQALGKVVIDIESA